MQLAQQRQQQAEGKPNKRWKRWLKELKSTRKEKLLWNKETFIKCFSDSSLFFEFREFAESDDASNYLKFTENYTRYVLESLIR